MIKRFVKLSVMFVIISVLYSGCSKVIQDVADNIKHELVGVDIQLAQSTQSIFDAVVAGNFKSMAKINILSHVKITNNNNIDLSIDKTSYEIFVDGINLAQGDINSTITLMSEETKILKIPIEVEVSKLLENGIDIMSKEKENKIKVNGKNYIHTALGDFIVNFTIQNGTIRIDSINYK